MAKKKTNISETKLQSKPPVVVVMGHVDHGKTTLLDTVRRSRIASGEHGNITQHIGAYQVPVGESKITFIDTPGHEAFTNLRSQGANVADIALLVIDATESVKLQTRESIKLIKQAKIPILVAINKIDLPTANPVRVKKDLLREDVIVEEHGGKIAVVEISAKKGTGIKDLLDTILLVAEFKQIQADASAPFSGVIIEAFKDKGKGCCATVIVQTGTVSKGDIVFYGDDSFKVRAVFDEYGKSIEVASPPGTPVEMLGFTSVPKVGIQVTSGDYKTEPIKPDSLSELQGVFSNEEESVLNILLKADTQGSLGAIIQGMPKGATAAMSGIGEVTEGDVTAAKANNLAIIGFNVRAPGRVKRFARDEGVRIRMYTIIYKLFEEIEEVVTALWSKPQKEILGKARVVKVFRTSSGKVAGCHIIEGRLARGDTVMVLRNDEVLVEKSRITTIRQEKDEVDKVEKGRKCGLILSAKVDFEVDDMIQSYILYELK